MTGMQRERLSILGRLAELRRRRAVGRLGRAAADCSRAEGAAEAAATRAAAAEAIRVRIAPASAEHAANGVLRSGAARARASASWALAADAQRETARAGAA